MPQWPHEYTVKGWRPDLAFEFEEFCRLIKSQGVVEPWPAAPEKPIYHKSYLVVGAHNYWAIGPQGDKDSPEEATVINRAHGGEERRSSASARAVAPGASQLNS